MNSDIPLEFELHRVIRQTRLRKKSQKLKEALNEWKRSRIESWAKINYCQDEYSLKRKVDEAPHPVKNDGRTNEKKSRERKVYEPSPSKETLDNINNHERLGRSPWQNMRDALDRINNRRPLSVEEPAPNDMPLQQNAGKIHVKTKRPIVRKTLRLRDLDHDVNSYRAAINASAADCLAAPLDWPSRKTLLTSSLDHDIASFRWRKRIDEETSFLETPDNDYERIRSDLEFVSARVAKWKEPSRNVTSLETLLENTPIVGLRENNSRDNEIR